MEFEWDPAKTATNRRKHGVSFEEAMTVFDDSCAIERFDPTHSSGEDRYVTLGTSERVRVLFVVHTLRHGDTIRIISARKATSGEANEYAQAQG
jgi:uncharacterized DUF497 family protein